MNKVNVFIYSYKGKMLEDVVTSILSDKKAYSNIFIFDQSPLFKEKFNKKFNIYYNHIFWDVTISPSHYVYDFIEASDSEYTLIMDDNILVSNNWFEVLSGFCSKNDVIVSGNKETTVSIDGLFYLQKTFVDSENFELNNFIDKSFIFGKTEMIKKINYPRYLKYNGISETISMELFSRGIEIYSCPSSTYSKSGVNTLETLYTPFSINHNYNQAVDLMHHGKNNFTDINKNQFSIGEFEKFHNIHLKSINHLPFLTNDVEYDPYKLDFQNADSRKFIDRTRVIS